MIYFIEAIGSGRIKIGFSATNVAARMATLATASAFPLELLGTIDGDLKLEHRLHEAFWDHRVAGEWFVASSLVRSFIQDLLGSPVSSHEEMICKAEAAEAERRAYKAVQADQFAEKANELRLSCIAAAVAKRGSQKLADAVGRSADTIRNWNTGRSAIGLDGLVALAREEPELFAPLREHLRSALTANQPTAQDRIARIERDLQAIRKELAA